MSRRREEQDLARVLALSMNDQAHNDSEHVSPMKSTRHSQRGGDEAPSPERWSTRTPARPAADDVFQSRSPPRAAHVSPTQRKTPGKKRSRDTDAMKIGSDVFSGASPNASPSTGDVARKPKKRGRPAKASQSSESQESEKNTTQEENESGRDYGDEDVLGAQEDLGENVGSTDAAHENVDKPSADPEAHNELPAESSDVTTAQGPNQLPDQGTAEGTEHSPSREERPSQPVQDAPTMRQTPRSSAPVEPSKSPYSGESEDSARETRRRLFGKRTLSSNLSAPDASCAAESGADHESYDWTAADIARPTLARQPKTPAPTETQTRSSQTAPRRARLRRGRSRAGARDRLRK